MPWAITTIVPGYSDGLGGLSASSGVMPYFLKYSSRVSGIVASYFGGGVPAPLPGSDGVGGGN